MPFVAKEEVQELETLRVQNERMAAQLSEFEEMRPHLQLAGEIRDAIVDGLENNEDGLDARSIAEKAYSSVLRRKVDEARDEVAARYEQEHRRTLYERLLGEVATSEGEEISGKVREKVETDPDLAVKLKESARKELAARATDVVRAEITAEQQIVINKEAERQIDLDRLDVKLALDGELDLASEDVIRRIKPGDKVELFFSGEGQRRGSITLTWTKDANGKSGWIYTNANEKLVNTSGYEEKVDDSRFIRVGVVNKDLENGNEVIQADRLAVGLPLVFIQKSAKGTISKRKLYYGPSYVRYNSYGNPPHYPVTLVGTDFHTKDIVFTSASGS